MKIKRGSLYVLILLSALSIGLFAASVVGNADENLTFDYKGEILAEYAKGTYFEVPELTVRSDAGVQIADYRLFYPNNRESANPKNYLDVEGNYVLKYYYELNGERREISKEFDVYTSVVSFFGSDQAEFTVDTYLNPDINTGGTEYKGLGVSSKKVGTVVTYLREIDLSDNTKNDTLIEFIANPQTVNIAEITSFTVTLTDVNDPDNFVKISVKNVSYVHDYYLLWAKANFNYSHLLDNPTYGIGLNRGNTYSLDGGRSPGFGANGSNKTANSYGAANGNYSMSSVTLCLDYAERAIYCTPRYGTNSFVADLDLTSDVGAGNEWQGFSTDKAILSIETNLAAGSANYIILNVDGYDMSDYKIADTEGPTVAVDYGNIVPFGVVGKNYPLFDCKVKDNVDDITDAPTVEVFDGNGRKVIVKDNGFVPQTAGEYKIVYTVFDTAGNRGAKVVGVSVKEEYGDSALKFADVSAETIDIKIGERLSVNAEEITGGSGDITHSYAILYDGQVVAQDFDGYVFNRYGDFALRYVVKDYLGTTATKYYAVNVQPNNEPTFEMPFLTDYYIFGKTYYLPKTAAYDFSHDTDGETVEVKVKVNGLNLDSDFKWVPVQAGAVDIVYYAVSKYDVSRVSEKTKTVTVVKPSGTTFITDYFVKNNVETWLTANGAVFGTQNADNGFRLIHPVATANLSFDFDVFTDGQKEVDANFSGFNVVLTDSLDPDIRLKLTFKKATETVNDAEIPILTSKISNLYLNGVYCSNVTGSFYGTTNNSFSLSYDEKGYRFIDDNDGAVLVTVKTDLSGKPFNGFPSGQVYVGFDFEGVTGDSRIELSRLSNQPFNDGQQMDKTNPFIILSDEIATSMQVSSDEDSVVKPPSLTSCRTCSGVLISLKMGLYS